MKKSTIQQQLPKGMSEKRVRALIDYYDNQTEDEEYLEIEQAIRKKELFWVAVPKDLVEEVNRLIARRTKSLTKK